MLLPSLFGLQFTKLGLLVNLLAVDLFVYLSYRFKGYLWADMVELVDTLVLGTSALRREGSSPFRGT